MTVSTQQHKLQVGILGLGRMGSIHAKNFTFNVPRASVIAVCDKLDHNLEWAKTHLPATVARYNDVDDMFKNSGIQAVLIATETSTHAAMAEKAWSYGLVSTWRPSP
jgi:predicted dehydrogenase